MQTMAKAIRKINTTSGWDIPAAGMRLSSQPSLIRSNHLALQPDMISDTNGLTCIPRMTLFNEVADKDDFSAAMATKCDVAIHRGDIDNYVAGKPFLTEGEGIPKIVPKMPELESKYPCLWEACVAHEEQHVKDYKASCKQFKECVDKHSKPSDDKKLRISKDDFVKCSRENKEREFKSCVEDEKRAYTVSIARAEKLLKKPKCEKEGAKLRQNIKLWKRIKDNSPTCTRKAWYPEEFRKCYITGQPLDNKTRAYMEPRFGHDFSRVRIHADAKAAESARAINARAYTSGNDIVFGSGEYQPQTQTGKELIAHELTHAVQNSGPVIRRKVKLANDADTFTAGIYTDADLDLFYDAIEGNHSNLEGFIEGEGKVYKGIGGSETETSKSYRERLVKDILSGLLGVSMQFEYTNYLEVYDDVYKRATASMYMRTSQGTSKVSKVRYPGSVGAKANKEAAQYWDVTLSGDDYSFELNATGKDNAYEALRSILFDGESKADTSRMHCDYVISAIHFMTMAEDMGTDVFDDAVRDGDITVLLHDAQAFDPTLPDSIAVWGGANTSPTTYEESKKSLTKVIISGESELIVGDHLMFYNHSAYNAMNDQKGQSWRLENAFVTDKRGSGDSFRFQGHGYYSPKERLSFIKAMRDKFNKLYDMAEALVTAGKDTDLTTEFPFVKLKTGVTSSTDTDDYEVIYSKSGDSSSSWADWSDIPSGDSLSMDLRAVTTNDYPNPFARWGEDKESLPEGTAEFTVRRPAEGLKD